MKNDRPYVLKIHYDYRLPTPQLLTNIQKMSIQEDSFVCMPYARDDPIYIVPMKLSWTLQREKKKRTGNFYPQTNKLSMELVPSKEELEEVHIFCPIVRMEDYEEGKYIFQHMLFQNELLFQNKYIHIRNAKICTSISYFYILRCILKQDYMR